jgi:hypothetical protein
MDGRNKKSSAPFGQKCRSWGGWSLVVGERRSPEVASSLEEETIMNIDDPTAHYVGVRRLARAALVAGAITLGASAFGHTAIANADWDIEAYDDCLSVGTDEGACCRLSGGEIGDKGVCVAPPARILQNVQGVQLQPKFGQPGRLPMPPAGVTGAQTAVTNPR